MRRKFLSVVVLLILSLATGSIITLASPAAPPSPPIPLPDSVSSPGFGYIVRYINDNPYNPAAPMPGDDLNFMPDGQAQIMVDAANNSGASSVGNPNGYHAGYDDLGFLAPQFGDPVRSIFTFNCSNCDSGNAPADRINMPAPNYIDASEACIRLVIGHETFHHTQYAYITFNNWESWGTMPVEGTARYMQDKIYSDLDANAGCITYRGTINTFLGSPNQVIWDASYRSALFWNYLGEQLGSETAEPIRGADFVREFWEQAQALNASSDLVQAIRNTIAGFSNARTLEQLFQDFTIANYTKNMNLTGLPDMTRYRYFDENDGGSGNYDNVPVTNAVLGSSASSSVVRWGARYLQADVSTCPAGVVAFHADGDKAGFSLVGIKAGNTVDKVLPSTSTDYARALLQRAASPYIRLGAVVTGLNDGANFDYLFDCGQVRLTIMEPQVPQPIAYVGDLTAPEPFLIKLRVVGPPELGAPSVEGLTPWDFQVYVGDEDPANEAPVLSGAYVQGDYWLVAQAPAKASGSPTTYNLTVRLGDLDSETKDGAVEYQVKNVDQVLVIDKSGSMLDPAASPKITAAKNAASLFIDSARSTDQTAVVSFSGNLSETDDDAQLLYMLDLMDASSRFNAKLMVNGITAGGNTSIGDGLDKGRVELLSIRGRPVPPTERWIVLLSDGMENEAKFYNTVKADLINAGIKVNAIALGPLSDQVLMQAIAADTGGAYYYVDYPSLRPAPDSVSARDAAVDALPISLQLADVYASSAEVIQNHERLWEANGGIASGGEVELNIQVDEGGIDDGLFTVAFGDGSVKPQLFRPDDSEVLDGVGGASVFSGNTHFTFRVGTLNPGTWRLLLPAVSGSPQYRVILSGVNRQGARMRMFLGSYNGPQAGTPGSNPFPVGAPMPIFATLTDQKGPISGAAVVASVQHPDGTTTDLPLFDDGAHNDGALGDGLYGGMYTRTTVGSKSGQNDTVYSKNGSYPVALHAMGQDNGGQNFHRYIHGAFNIAEIRQKITDTDKDGMPDVYEVLHACLKFDNPDADADPDGDELESGKEYQLGTNPCDPDTDGGGESDLSEVNRGANPFDPSDDSLPRPIDASVISKRADHMDPQPDLKPNANLIRYPANPAYDKIRLLRSTSPNGPFNEVATFGAAEKGGLYHDEGLTNGTAYYYRLQGVDLNGHFSAPSHVFQGTPKADPFSPVGSVIIAGHAAVVDTPIVTLRFFVDPFLLLPARPDGVAGITADPEASQMMISNNASFAGASWETFNITRTWTLAPKNGLATVFVKFRDPSGNESEVYNDEVKVTGGGILGKIKLKLMLWKWLALNRPVAEDPSGPGTLVRVLGNSEQPPAYTDANGDAQVENLMPGTYDLLVEHPGYQPMIIPNVVVGEGQTVVLDPSTMVEQAIFMPIVVK